MGVARFPDPRTAPGDRPLAIGGDLGPATLLAAYRSGIFPWPTPAGTVLWWSPDPRAVLPLDGVHRSRTLERTLRQGRLRTTFDTAFAQVVAGCADREEGTWITPALAAAFCHLHELGHAHSVEVWGPEDRLVGGLYGLALGGAFMGESMFHRVPDASKVALVELVDALRAAGFSLFDVQLPSAHLRRLGAVELPREAFLTALRQSLQAPCVFPAGPAAQ